MTESLADACRIARVDGGRYAVRFADGWQQGPGVFGGLVMAAMADAVVAETKDETRPMRGFSCQLCAPVRADIDSELFVRTLRSGKKVSHVGVQVAQEGQVVAVATAALGQERATDVDRDEVAMPACAGVDQVAALPYVDLMPRFTRHVEMRPSLGSLPGSGEAAVVGGWVRFREPGPISREGLVLALLDSWWPAILAASATIRPVATLSMTAHFVGDLSSVDAGASALVRKESRAIRAGYADEEELLFCGGRLAAVSHQLVVAI